jgi:ribosome-associated protein
MKECLLREIKFRTSRSSGPGGQHVNKTETRVELLWDPAASGCLSETQKARVIHGLGKRLDEKGLLHLASGRERSQVRNREEVMQRFFDLLEACLVAPKKRRATRPTRASREKRLREKKSRSDLKRQRRDPSPE